MGVGWASDVGDVGSMGLRDDGRHAHVLVLVIVGLVLGIR
jgi:hypothetical protein